MAKAAGSGASGPKKVAAKKVAPVKGATPSAKKAVAKKAVAKNAVATKAVAKKAVANKAVAKKAPAKKAGAKAAVEKAPAKRPARSPFSAAWLRSQEQLLREERATYLHQAESLQAEADELVADFESGDVQFDEDGGEGDTLSAERERDLQLSAQARAAVDEIDHALAKFATGTYGICEASGEPIPQERLEAIPWARVQVAYKAGGFGSR